MDDHGVTGGRRGLKVQRRPSVGTSSRAVIHFASKLDAHLPVGLLPSSLSRRVRRQGQSPTANPSKSKKTRSGSRLSLCRNVQRLTNHPGGSRKAAYTWCGLRGSSLEDAGTLVVWLGRRERLFPSPLVSQYGDCFTTRVCKGLCLASGFVDICLA